MAYVSETTYLREEGIRKCFSWKRPNGLIQLTLEDQSTRALELSRKVGVASKVRMWYTTPGFYSRKNLTMKMWFLNDTA